MAKTRKILDRIHAVRATKQITQAMKMVAVAKLGKAKDRLAREKPYIEGYINLFDEITASHKPLPALFTHRPTKRVLLLCLTTNRGLCGAFNQHVLEKVLKKHDAYHKEGIEVDLLPIGQKGLDFLQRRERFCLTDYVDINYDTASTQISHLNDFLLSSFLQGMYDLVKIIYQPNKMAVREAVRVEQLLPFASSPSSEEGYPTEYHYEPTRQSLIENMAPRVLQAKLYKAWLLGTVAEQSVRMIVTSQATENAEKLIKELRLSYNRIRQSAITRSLSEIVAGADAMK